MLMPAPIMQRDLTEQLGKILTRAEVLKGDEQSAFLAQSDFIAVFAVSRMHLCPVVLSDGSVIDLRAGVSSKRPDKIVVHMFTPNFGRAISVSTVFQTWCDVSQWASAELLPAITPPVMIGGDWDFPLELDAEGRLSPFGKEFHDDA